MSANPPPARPVQRTVTVTAYAGHIDVDVPVADVLADISTEALVDEIKRRTERGDLGAAHLLTSIDDARPAIEALHDCLRRPGADLAAPAREVVYTTLGRIT